VELSCGFFGEFFADISGVAEGIWTSTAYRIDSKPL